MLKLSSVFETVNKNNLYEQSKKEYLAKKLVESHILTESNFDSIDVEEKLFVEAIKYNNIDDAIKFIKEIEELALMEGFLKNAWNKTKKIAGKIKDGVVKTVKKVIKKIKDFFTGIIVNIFSEFHTVVVPAVKKLQTQGLKKIDSNRRVSNKPLNNSLEFRFNHDYGYLFEETDLVVVPTEKTEEDKEEIDNSINALVTKLFSGKKVETGKKTGSTQKRLKFYAITKAGVNSTLWVGSTNKIDDMKVLLVYMKSSKKSFHKSF